MTRSGSRPRRASATRPRPRFAGRGTRIAAAWYDRLVGEAFPLVLAKGGEPPAAGRPRAGEPIIIGGVALNVGQRWAPFADRPALYRSDAEHADLRGRRRISFYPTMMAGFGIFPRSLGEAGLEEFREILAERLELKERAARPTDPAEDQAAQGPGARLKIVLNSVFGQTGNPYIRALRPRGLPRRDLERSTPADRPGRAAGGGRARS